MITLKTNPYNEKELFMLASLFEQLEEIMGSNCKKGETCKTCEYRHLCYDITSAKEHAIKKANEVKSK